MYPFIRMYKEMILAKKHPPIAIMDPHITRHICWPWDLDLWYELNNGRTLTLYDLGRIPLIIRTGIWKALRAKRWGITVAGGSLRYRRRVRMFDTFELYNRCIGWDSRFLYLEHAMWRKNECLNHALLRIALTDKTGIVSPDHLLEYLNQQQPSPPLPPYVSAWIESESLRAWPPEHTVPTK